ncbi:hypothetical protein SXCC_01116 [Gluconacetobacter sp. SXCC-1]|nr:hypothetical protein SXCC_01116 [Gluconacetobacter sp. SXCC-1]
MDGEPIKGRFVSCYEALRCGGRSGPPACVYCATMMQP